MGCEASCLLDLLSRRTQGQLGSKQQGTKQKKRTFQIHLATFEQDDAKGAEEDWLRARQYDPRPPGTEKYGSSQMIFCWMRFLNGVVYRLHDCVLPCYTVSVLGRDCSMPMPSVLSFLLVHRTEIAG
jgi:hypothetical protein